MILLKFIKKVFKIDNRDKIKNKIGAIKARTVTIILTIFLFINCVVSGVAIDLFLTRVAIEDNLEVTYKEEIQEKYILDNVRCYFDIYNIDETFTDFKFVFLISFKDIKIASLTNLSKLIGKRQLSGASKFYS